MAKAKQAQLQVDIVNDEEWEKFTQRDGLLVVDIYSEWCGPCVAMQGNLKKIKLELGGDFLHLGMARSTNIEALKRFANKSEPSWMFIAQGQQVGLLFGSNAPKLQRRILEEMKNERDCLEGKRERVQRLPSELSDMEQAAFGAKLKRQKEREQAKAEKASRILRERRVAQAKNILDSMAHLGLIIVLPHATTMALSVLDECLPNTGLAISKKERPLLTEEALENIEYLTTVKMPDIIRQHMSSDKSFALILTVDQEQNPGPVDETVLRFVYGESKQPPGDPGSPGFMLLRSEAKRRSREQAEALAAAQAQEVLIATGHLPEAHLDGGDELVGEEEEVEEEDEQEDIAPPPPELPMTSFMTSGMMFSERLTVEVEVDEEEEEEEEEEEYDFWGIWAPPNEMVKATAIQYCFPLITSALILPEPEPEPQHIAFAFEIIKKYDIFKLMEEYKNEVMAYGFFSSDQPDEAQLIAKTKQSYEKQHTGKD